MKQAKEEETCWVAWVALFFIFVMNNCQLYAYGLNNQDTDMQLYSLHYQLVSWFFFHVAVIATCATIHASVPRALILGVLVAYCIYGYATNFHQEPPPSMFKPFPIHINENVPETRIMVFVDEDKPTACTYAEIWTHVYTTFEVSVVSTDPSDETLIHDALAHEGGWTVYLRDDAEAFEPELFQTALTCAMQSGEGNDVIFLGSNSYFLRKSWHPFADHVGIAMSNQVAEHFGKGMPLSKLCMSGEIKCHRMELLRPHHGYDTEFFKFCIMNIASLVVVLLSSLIVDMPATNNKE